MADNNIGSSAFPFVSMGGIHEHQYFDVGLSKREKFAETAMKGLLSDGWATRYHQKDIVAAAVSYADALIEELNK